MPNRIKQAITTLQIAQFVIGASYAFAHLFIAYSIPVSVPYIYSSGELTSGLASEVSSAASVATSSATAGLGSWLKKVAFRAAGEEGLAENVLNDEGSTFGIDALHAAQDLKAREEIRYRDEWRTIHCIDTSGQVSAILINCFYLAPLTWLFVRFFIRSYMRRGEGQGKKFQRHVIEESSKDAITDVKKALGQALDEMPSSPDNQAVGEDAAERPGPSETSSTTVAEQESSPPEAQSKEQGS